MVRDALIGLAVGDALGVPVEFKSRMLLRTKPVTGMQGYGTHHQPPGTWSDDSSLAFCLADTIANGFDLSTLAESFVRWYHRKEWTPHGEVFDVGIATRQAISRLSNGCQPDLAGGFHELDNGNGSLMRILPLVFYMHNKPTDERFELVRQVSGLTHRHVRSVIACFYYTEFARLLIHRSDPQSAYETLKETVPVYLHRLEINEKEIGLFSRLLTGNIFELEEDAIRSSGYVLHTLEASIWCLLTTQNYRDAVLKAVNLGDDTDTTGAVTGGLAGILYGEDGIPAEWKEVLARRQDIEHLAGRLAGSIVTN